MRDNLPSNPRKYEYGIVNLDDSEGSGTHWVAYKKRCGEVEYFDSFGSLHPPKEVIHYFRNCNLMFNYDQYQTYNTYNCGALALTFLYDIINK